MEKKFYLAADKNGDVFIYNELPERRTSNYSTNEIFWSSNGDEEKVMDSNGWLTTFGRLLNIPDEIIQNIDWEDEPTEIKISIMKV